MDRPAFYELSEAERVALTERAISQGGTVLERWSALAAPEAEGWNPRAAMAAAWLADQPGVLDLGCGLMTLERHLRRDQSYAPSDVVRRDARTLVCDLNREPPPRVDAPAVACLGVLEYLHDPLSLLSALAQAHRVCVVSYCVTDAPAPLDARRAHAWVNDLDTRGVEALFTQAGWSIERTEMVDGLQRLWRLSSSRFRPAAE